MRSNGTLSAVLTGDLIDSRTRGADEINASMQALAKASNELGKQYGFDPRFTRHRGDGWQIILPAAKHSLNASIALLAALRTTPGNLHTRIAIGVGTAEYLGTDDLSDAVGTAFESSGDLLNQISKHSYDERLIIFGSGITKWPQAVIAMADWISRGWTSRQAEAVAMVLLDLDLDTHARRARALGITRQAFEARLKGSGLAAMDIARGAFQAHKFITDAQ